MVKHLPSMTRHGLSSNIEVAIQLKIYKPVVSSRLTTGRVVRSTKFTLSVVRGYDFFRLSDNKIKIAIAEDGLAS